MLFVRSSFLVLAMATVSSDAFSTPSTGTSPAAGPKNKLHDEMIILDGACPLTSWGMDPYGYVLDPSGKGCDPYIQGGVTAVAATVSGGRLGIDDVRRAINFHDTLIEKRDFMKIRSVADIKRCKKEGKFGLWYHMQSGFCVEDNLDLLVELKAAGVGHLQPAYNYRNQFASGQLDRSDAGLSKAGIELVKKCNELKIIVDGSHNSPQDTLDMIKFSSAPVIVSHANCKAVYDHPRNIPDEVILAIAKNGGIIGVVGWPVFVCENPNPTLDQFFAHLEHVIKLVGPDHASLGMDYYQMIQGLVPDDEVQKLYDTMIESGAWTEVEYSHPPYNYPTGLQTPATLSNLTQGLQDRGYGDEDIQKIMGGNWMRVIQEVWGNEE